jgi:probable lipoprotein NlpC
MMPFRASSPVTLGLLALTCAAVLQGCATSGGRQPGLSDEPDVMVPTTGTRGEICCALAERIPAQEALAQAASGLLGRSQVEVRGKRFTSDCSGLARGVYATQGIDLYSGLGELDGGNGVGRIFTHVVQHGKIHYGPTVHPGDLVFFHNTWDFNHDGRPNDALTHVGVVEQVELDGTVVFVSWVSRGVERYRMNLMTPDQHKAGDGRVLNDFMRRKEFGDSKANRYLTGQLFAAFGTLLR